MKVRQDAWTEEDDLLLAETVLRHVREGSTQLNAFEEVGDKLDRTSAACGFRWNAVVRHSYEKALQLAKKQRKQRQRILGKDQGGKKKLLYSPPVPTFEDAGLGTAEISIEPLSASGFDTLEMQDKLGLDGIQQWQESLLLEDSDIPADSQQDEMEPQRARMEEPSITEGSTHLSGLTIGHVIAFLQNLNNSHFHSDIYKSESERLRRELAGMKKENLELAAKVEELSAHAKTVQEDYETLMQIMNRARKLVLFEEEDRSSTSFKMDRNGNLEKMAE